MDSEKRTNQGAEMAAEAATAAGPRAPAQEKKSGKRKAAVFMAVLTVIVAAGIFVYLFLIAGNRDRPVLAGQSLVVTVMADSIEDAYGYQFELNYDRTQLAYEGELASRIDEIPRIFQKSMGGYELVGATMVGEKPGYSARNEPVCEMVFKVLRDGNLSELDLSLSGVNVVKATGLEYIEGVEGWRWEAAVRAAE